MKIRTLLFLLVLLQFFFSCNSEDNLQKSDEKNVNIVIEDGWIVNPEWISQKFESCTITKSMGDYIVYFPTVHKVNFKGKDYLYFGVDPKDRFQTRYYYDGDGNEIKNLTLIEMLKGSSWEKIFDTDPIVVGPLMFDETTPAIQICEKWGNEEKLVLIDWNYSLVYYDPDRRNEFLNFVSQHRNYNSDDVFIRNDTGEDLSQIENDPVLGKRCHAEVKLDFKQLTVNREPTILYAAPLISPVQAEYPLTSSYPMITGDIYCEPTSESQVMQIKKYAEAQKLIDYGYISDNIYRLVCKKETTGFISTHIDRLNKAGIKTYFPEYKPSGSDTPWKKL